MARIIVLLVLMIAVVAEGSALLQVSKKPQIVDAQLVPNAVDDLLRKTAALDRSIASLDTRLRVVEGAQAGVRAKTDDITKVLSDLQARPPTRQKLGNSK
jgi:hypothetical protein